MTSWTAFSKNRMVRAISAALLSLLLAALTAAPALAAALLRAHFIDVGQADSILVQAPSGENILVDGGNKEDGPAVVKYLEKAGVKKLDVVIATHPHEDHIGGLPTVISAFPVGTFYMPKVSHTTETFENLISAVKRSGAKRLQAKGGIALKLAQPKGGPALTAALVGPQRSDYDDMNDFSAVLLVKYGDTGILLAGDAGVASEFDMLAQSATKLAATVLKVGHHGSSTASSAAFLDAVSPKHAVISCGKGNIYGHPSPETLAALKKIKATIWRTDEQGTIVATSDGKTVTVKPETASAPATAVAPVVKPKTKPAPVTVYVTNTGKKYHLAGCRYLARSTIPIHLTDALARGYEPCSVCKPPTR